MSEETQAQGWTEEQRDAIHVRGIEVRGQILEAGEAELKAAADWHREAIQEALAAFKREMNVIAQGHATRLEMAAGYTGQAMTAARLEREVLLDGEPLEDWSLTSGAELYAGAKAGHGTKAGPLGQEG